MLAIALSLLFGITALLAVVEIHRSVTKGLRRGILIGAELAHGRAREAQFKRAAARPLRICAKLGSANHRTHAAA